jgi:hypothetical protein
VSYGQNTLNCITLHSLPLPRDRLTGDTLKHTGVPQYVLAGPISSQHSHSAILRGNVRRIMVQLARFAVCCHSCGCPADACRYEQCCTRLPVLEVTTQLVHVSGGVSLIVVAFLANKQQGSRWVGIGLGIGAVVLLTALIDFSFSSAARLFATDKEGALPNSLDGMQGAYLGPEFDQDDINRRLTAIGARFSTVPRVNMLDATARLWPTAKLLAGSTSLIVGERPSRGYVHRGAGTAVSRPCQCGILRLTAQMHQL